MEAGTVRPEMDTQDGTRVDSSQTIQDSQMSPIEIRTTLSDIVNNSSSYGLEAYVVRKDSPKLRKMALAEGDGSDAGFRSVLKDMLIEVIRDTYLADGGEYADGSLLADNQKKILYFEQGDQFHPFTYLKATEEYADFQEDDLNQAVGFLFCLRKGTESIYLYQHLWSIMVPNKKRTGIVTRLVTGENKVIFSEQKERLITIAKKIDIVIFDDYLITGNTKLLQNNFGFQDYINQFAQRVVQSISRTGLVANTEKLTGYISRGKTKYARKMMRIGTSPVLRLSKERLVEKVNTVERWKGKFQIDESGEITLNTYADVENIIDLFDERYTRSDITDTEYDTDVKSVAAPAEVAG